MDFSTLDGVIVRPSRSGSSPSRDSISRYISCVVNPLSPSPASVVLRIGLVTAIGCAILVLLLRTGEFVRATSPDARLACLLPQNPRNQNTGRSYSQFLPPGHAQAPLPGARP